jgi:predicted phosphodiesterase
MGHRHVPYAVQIHKTLLVNAGTFSCTRTRAHFGNTFNIIDFEEKKIDIRIVNIGEETEKPLISLDIEQDCCHNALYDH